jgi:CrcB protein
MTPAATSKQQDIIMTLYLWVMLGGALGTGGRFALSGFAAHRWGETFPWGTLIINVTGSFVIGLFAALTGPEGRWVVNPVGRQFFLVGICGGYTTFSSFSLQTLTLAQDGEWLRAGGNVLGSFILCLVAVWLGHAAAMAINNTSGAS